VDAVKEVNPLTDGVEGYTQALQASATASGDLRTVAGDQLSSRSMRSSRPSDLQTALDNVGSGGIGNSLTEIATPWRDRHRAGRPAHDRRHRVHRVPVAG